MSIGAMLRLMLGFGLLVVLHFSLRPLLGWRAELDFLTVALLVAAVRLRPGAAALVGCLMGLANDSLTPTAFGSGALAMTIVGFTASWLKAVFFADNLALNALMFFLGKWAIDVIRLLAERRMGGSELAMQLAVWSPLSAAVTAVVGIIVLLTLRPLLEPQHA